jgi:hypothetical protein
VRCPLQEQEDGTVLVGFRKNAIMDGDEEPKEVATNAEPAAAVSDADVFEHGARVVCDIWRV